MRLINLLFALIYSYCNAKVERPRGVPLSQETLYSSSSDFTCLDGLKTIPHSHVNDDYCDCLDASDEPGTSACPHRTFYCQNGGFEPIIIPSSRVNDGICDCCDGSDEWKNNSICQNTCKELYTTAHAEFIRQIEEANKGFDIRMQYATQGQQIKRDNQAKLVTLKAEVELAAKKVSDILAEKEETEKSETEAKQAEQKEWEELKAKVATREDLTPAVDAFVYLDVDRDAIVTLQEILPHQELGSNNVLTEEAAKIIMGGDSVEVTDFLEVIWPLISENFVFLEQQNVATLETPPEPARLDEDDEEGEDENEENYEDKFMYEPPEEDEVEETDEEEEFWDESGKHLVPQHKTQDEENPIVKETTEQATGEPPTPPARSSRLPDNPPYNPVTKILIEASEEVRSLHQDAVNEKSRLEREISDIENTLDYDFGPDEAFYALKGKCFELKTLEYIYKLCPFDRSVQIPIKGDSETSLGKWDNWSGPPDNKYTGMKYQRGLKCWNGPNRSTEVILKCGSENTVSSASEPSRCEYRFEFTTPAICQKIYSSHDEL